MILVKGNVRVSHIKQLLTVYYFLATSVYWKVESMEKIYTSNSVWVVGDGGQLTKCAFQTSFEVE